MEKQLEGAKKIMELATESDAMFRVDEKARKAQDDINTSILELNEEINKLATLRQNIEKQHAEFKDVLMVHKEIAIPDANILLSKAKKNADRMQIIEKSAKAIAASIFKEKQMEKINDGFVSMNGEPALELKLELAKSEVKFGEIKELPVDAIKPLSEKSRAEIAKREKEILDNIKNTKKTVSATIVVGNGIFETLKSVKDSFKKIVLAEASTRAVNKEARKALKEAIANANEEMESKGEALNRELNSIKQQLVTSRKRLDMMQKMFEFTMSKMKGITKDELETELKAQITEAISKDGVTLSFDGKNKLDFADKKVNLVIPPTTARQKFLMGVAKSLQKKIDDCTKEINNNLERANQLVVGKKAKPAKKNTVH